MDFLVKKFPVSIEIPEVTCYIKMIDKRDNNTLDELTEALYLQFKNNIEVEKLQIRKLIHHYSNIFSPDMLKDEKISCFYNAFTKEYINDNSITDDETLFLLKLKDLNDDYFSKDTIMNHLSDTFGNNVFIMDVRHYKTIKKHYNVEFELYLTPLGLNLVCEEQSFVDYFLQQYTINDVLKILNLVVEHPFIGPTQILTETSEKIEEFFIANNQFVISKLLTEFQEHQIIFINRKLLNYFHITLDDFISSTDQMKLVVFLETSEYNSGNYNRISQPIKYERKDHIYILTINETIFREACGSYNYVMFMTESDFYSFSIVNEHIPEFLFFSKSKINGLKNFQSIIKEFTIRSLDDNYFNELSINSFLLSNDELSKLFSYFIMYGSKVEHTNTKSRNSFRSKLTHKTCDSIIEYVNFLSQINKSITLNDDTTKYLLFEAEDMLCSISNLIDLKEFFNKFIYLLETLEIELDIEKFKTIYNIKQNIIENKKDICFIFNSDILLQDPDIINNFLNGRNILIPSSVIRKIESEKGKNFLATKALRNISILKSQSKNEITIVDDSAKDDFETNTCLIELATSKLSQGNYPILLTNNNDLTNLATDKNLLVASNQLLKTIFR